MENFKLSICWLDHIVLHPIFYSLSAGWCHVLLLVLIMESGAHFIVQETLVLLLIFIVFTFTIRTSSILILMILIFILHVIDVFFIIPKLLLLGCFLY